jgi:hypothetical protein
MKRKNVVLEDVGNYIFDLLACEKSLDLGGFVKQNLKLSVMEGLYDNELLYALHTLIPAENMKEETYTLTVKCPFDWKQAFKEQHFPEWLKKRYPVKYKEIKETVKFTAYSLYPKFPALMPDRSMDSIQHITKSYERYEEEKIE